MSDELVKELIEELVALRNETGALRDAMEEMRDALVQGVDRIVHELRDLGQRLEPL